jgi:hypothetical protein
MKKIAQPYFSRHEVRRNHLGDEEGTAECGKKNGILGIRQRERDEGRKTKKG